MIKFKAPFLLEENLQNYLSGKLFSNFKSFRFDSKTFIPERIELLKDLLENKTVLHFGCCDHEQIIEEKIRNNTHLQVILSKITEKCIGIDNNANALKKMKSLNVDNCFFYDLFQTSNPEIENAEYQYVLLGEILEHIPDPVLFLRKIHDKFKGAENIIVTVPNAFSTRNFFNIKKGIEEINTDHKYWFTPFTISKVLTEAGFTLESIFFTDRSRITFQDKIVKWYYYLQRKNPFTSKKWNVSKANGLVAIAKFS